MTSLITLSGEKKARVQAQRDALVHATPGICAERAHIYTQCYQQYQHEPAILKRAHALRTYLEKVSLDLDDNLLPGWQSSHPRWAPIFPEYSWKWVYDELDRFNQRQYDRFQITPEVKEELHQLLPWWEGRSLLERVLARQPQFVQEATRIGAISWMGQATSGEGHIIVDYPMVLTRGFRGMRDQAEELLDGVKQQEPENPAKRDFYQAVQVVFEGVLHYLTRLIHLIDEISKTSQPQRKVEFKTLAEDLRTLHERPAESFRQALLTIWLVHMVEQMESNGHSASLGRLDQYLYPYYQQDIDDGRLTPEDALELLEHFYLKIFSIIKLRSESHARTQTGYPTYQNLCVGGQTPQGKDAVNPLSWLCLSAVAEIRLSEPNFYVRVHPGTPSDFLNAALEVVRMGFGMPAFVNDEVIIPSLERVGVSHEDALNYSSMGCVEVQVPGKWGYRANGKSKLNVLKVLELALHNGRDPLRGTQLHEGKGDLPEMKDFSALLDAWREQLAYYTNAHVTADNIIDQELEELAPNAFCSSLVQDCMKRGKHLNAGGAVYDITGGCQVGFPNVGNSLAAIQELVFEQKILSAADLMEAMQANFETPQGEEVRQILLNHVPKYGEDENLPDEMTCTALEDYIQLLEPYKNLRHGRGPIGGGYTASTNTVSANITAGENVGATPDGRKRGEPTADGISPQQGTGRKGPTAIFCSVSKMPTEKVTGGQLLNVRLNQQSLQSPQGIEHLSALLRGFFDLRGWHVQFNTISTEVLREAIKHPEKYPDLIVRVAGYSALFTALDPSLQRDIIARMEHSV